MTTMFWVLGLLVSKKIQSLFSQGVYILVGICNKNLNMLVYKCTHIPMHA